jgi:hypothetical protein
MEPHCFQFLITFTAQKNKEYRHEKNILPFNHPEFGNWKLCPEEQKQIC